jgi:hypothetical protein
MVASIIGHSEIGAFAAYWMRLPAPTTRHPEQVKGVPGGKRKIDASDYGLVNMPRASAAEGCGPHYRRRPR